MKPCRLGTANRLPDGDAASLADTQHAAASVRASGTGSASPHVLWLRVVALSEIGKRMLMGRKQRRTQLEETLLPKRIALPGFASDALSRVA
jgi:hypothetical protein